MTVAPSFRPGRRRSRPGSAGFRRTALAPLALAFGFALLLGPAPAAAQHVLGLVSADFSDVLEGDTGSSTPLTLRVQVRENGLPVASSTVEGTVDWFLERVSGGDFVFGTSVTAAAASGTLMFEAGDIEKALSFTIVGDDDFSRNEIYLLRVVNPTGTLRFPATQHQLTRTGRIINDDPPPLVVNSPRVNEGAQGETATLSFTVLLDSNGHDFRPAAEFKYRVTPDSTATPDDDYVAVAGTTLTKPEGTSTDFTWTIDVTVNGDDTGEPDETVEIEFYDITVDPIAEAQDLGLTTAHPVATFTATGTIVNDDLPGFTVAPTSVTEGATTATLTFRVTADTMLDSPTNLPWTTTASGTATADVDFVAENGTVAFAAGDISATFDVTVIGDEIYELDEVMEVEVTPPGGTAITARGTILNDEPRPLISFDSPSVQEGDSGDMPTLPFMMTMDPVSDRDVTITFEVATDSGTAVSGTDFDVQLIGRTFAPGDRTQSFDVTVLGDNALEADETVVFHILELRGDARLATSTLTVAELGAVLTTGTRLLATGTILDDEPRVSASVHPQSVLEGAAGSTTEVELRFTLDRPARTTLSLTYQFATEASTAQYGVQSSTDGEDDIREDGGSTAFSVGDSVTSITLTVRGDDRSEPNETATFRITEASPDDRLGIGTATATVTIIDDDLPRLSIDSPEVVEGDTGTTDLVFTVSLTDAATGTVTADWAVTGGTAVDPGDYVLVDTPGTLTFNPGATSTTITVRVNGDLDVERDETVMIGLSNVSAGAQPGTVEGTGTIRDDDVPVVSIAAPSAVVEGNAGASTTMTFPITLDRPSYQEVTVTWGLANATGTATAGTDFRAPGGTLTVASGTVTANAVVTVLGDDLDEDDETVVAELVNANGADVSLTAFEAAGTITDDDLPSSVSITGTSTTEGAAGSMTTLAFTIALDRPSGRAVTVTFAEAIADTAVQVRAIGDPLEAGDDIESRYPPGAPGTHTFPPGQVSHVVNYVVHGDDRVEEDEEVRLAFTGPAVNGTLGNTSGVGTILNDDFATVTVAPAAIDEGDAGRSELSFVLTMDRVADVDVEIGHEVRASSTATVADGDFVAPASGPVTIAAGTTSATFAVQVQGDTKLESDETVVVLFEVEEPLAPPPPDRAPVSFAGGALTAEATGTIRNDDALTVAFVGPLARTVDEGDAGATTTEAFTVRLSGVSDGETTVEVAWDATVSQSAERAATGVLNPDFTTSTDEIVFPAGVREMPFEVYVLDDGRDEPDENAVFDLRNPSAGVSVASPGGEIVVTIRDDDVPELAVDSPGDVSEGDDGDATAIQFTVMLEPAAHQDVTVAYAYGGTADGDDFTSAPVDGTLTFTAGETSKTLDLEVSGDGNPEPNETVTVTLSNPMPAGAATVATSTGEARIVNDDDATLTISSPSVNEGAAGATTPLVFEVELSPAVPTEVTVDWSVVDASSTQVGVTYPGGSRSGTLTFPPNATDPRTITVNVAGNDEHGPDRFVVIELTGATGGAVVLDPRGRGTITDDDDPVLSVADARVDEGATGTTAALGFALTLDRAPHGAVTVDWQVTGTLTTEPDDWVGGTQPVSGTVTFAAGERTKTAVVGTVRGDDIGEDDERLEVRFSNPTGDAMFAGGALTVNVTGTIANDDDPVLSVDSPSVAEGSSTSTPSATLAFTVTLDPVSDRDVTFTWGDLTGTSGSADSGDYTFVTSPGQLTVPAGQSTTTISATVTGDDVSERSETVVIELTNPMPTGHVTFAGGVSTLEATGTIVNDDSITLSVTAPADVDENEDGATTELAFVVELSAAATEAVTVDWQAGGTADAADFASGSRRPGQDETLTFNPGDTRETLTFTVEDDREAEPDETLRVVLRNLRGPAFDSSEVTLDPTPAEVTIGNDDIPELTVSGAVVDEGDAGTEDLVFRLSLDPPDYEAVSVTYAVTGVTATAGADYGTPVPASPLVIPAGDRGATIRIPVTEDDLVEADETLTLKLTGITGNGATRFLGGASMLSATGTIVNDDIPRFRIDSPEVEEGSSTTTPARTLTFTVSLAPTSTGPVSVEWAVTGGTATQGTDYTGPTPAMDTLTFTAGETSKTLPVITVVGDDEAEAHETVEITLTNPTGGAAIDTGTGRGRILNDDSIALSVTAPADADEGDTGTRDLVFAVELTSGAPRPLTVAYRVGGTADGGDFVRSPARSETLRFGTGATSTTLSFGVRGDRDAERDETVTVTLVDGSLTGVENNDVTLGTASATAVIGNDDEPELALAVPATVDEGDAGTTDLTFTLRLDRRSYEDVTVEYALGGTADGGDYGTSTPASPLTIPAGDTEATVTVPVTGDTVVEASETVTLTLSNLMGGAAVFAGGGATLEASSTIVNDDIPLFSIDSPEIPEGATGTTPLVFTVSLDPAATSGTPTVDWAVTGVSTADAADYTGAASGTLTFQFPSYAPQTIPFTVNGDGTGEPDETVVIALTNPTGGARIREGGGTGTGTIRNDDLPDIEVADARVDEGSANAPGTLVFEAELDPIENLPGPWTYGYEVVAGGTAVAGIDFPAGSASGTLVFGAGETEGKIEFLVSGDGDPGPDRTVAIRVFNPVNGAELGTATGTIVNDDLNLPRITVDAEGNAEEPAGEGATGTLAFVVRLSVAASATVAVDWSVGGTATEGEDFVFGDSGAPGRLTFEPGTDSRRIELVVLGDLEPEVEETVVVTLSDPSGGTIRRGEATGLIRDLPILSLAGSPEAYEGAMGTSTLAFEARLSTPSSGDVTFSWEVTGGTADPAADLAVTSGTGTIMAGDLSTTVEVEIAGEDPDRDDETVVIGLASASGAVVLAEGATAEGTIVDDDGTLSVGIDAPLEVTEGTETHLEFTVTLSATTTEDVSVPYEVVADGGELGAAPVIVIPAGRTSVTIRIPLVDDDLGETEDTVTVRLGIPTAATGVEVVLRDKDEVEVTVNDDDADDPMTTPTVSVDALEERDGLARFVVNVLPPLGSDLTFGYRVEGGTLASPPQGIARALRAKLTVYADEKGAEFLIRPDAGVGRVSFTVTELNPAGGAAVQVNENERTATGSVTRVASGRSAKALGYVLAGIGRTVATNIVDLVWDRAENHRSGVGGSHATVGGRRIDTAAFAEDGDGALLRAAVGLAGDLLGVDTDSRALLRDAERRLARGEGLGALRDWTDLPSARDLAGRTDFALSFANGEGLAPYTFWGRGSFTAFESGLDGGALGDFSSEGEVVAGHLGLDYRFREDMLAGVALSHTMGDVDYGFAGDGGSRGAVETELTGVHPYLHWMSPDGLGVWGTLGYGTGSAELEDGDGTVETDLAMEMMAVGVRDELAYLADMDLAVKGDAFMAGISADEVAGSIDAVDSDVFRVRAAVEGSNEWVTSDGGVFVGRFELGARLDGGDAEEGFGADLAAGFDWVVPELGLEVRGRASMLLVHEESDFREWGLGLGLVWDPGVSGRGLRLSVEPTWNAPSAGGAAAMWDAGPGGGGTATSARGASLDARLGYGMGVLDDRALATVFGELGRTDGDARLRLGAGLGRPDAGGRGLGLELYGERRDRAAGPDDSLVLKGRFGF